MRQRLKIRVPIRAAGLLLSALVLAPRCRAQDPQISYELQQVLKAGRGVRRLAFSSKNGLVTFGDKISVWNPVNGALLVAIDSDGRDRSAAISPDGRLLAAGNNRTIGLWELATGTSAHMITGLSKPTALAFSPDRPVLAYGNDDGVIELWNVKLDRSVGQMTGHKGKIIALSYSPDGQTLVSASEDKTVRSWDVGQLKEKRSLSESQSEYGDVTAVAFSPGADFFAVGLTEVKRDDSNRRASSGPPQWNRMVKVRNAQGDELASFSGNAEDIASVAVDSLGRLAASGGPDKTVRLWDVGRRSEIATLAQDNSVIAVALSPDAGWLAATGKNGDVSVWKIHGVPQPEVAVVKKHKRHEVEEEAQTPDSPAAAPAPAPEVDLASYMSPVREDDFALVIGVENYLNLPKADYAERDAAAFRSHVEALGVPVRNIIFLAGDHAGFSAFKKYLQSWLPRNVKPTSRVYFYFSGHGAPDPKSGEAYLVPWDADANFLADTAYPIKLLYKNLTALPAAEIFVALDSCFSGGDGVLPKGARPLVTKVDVKSPPDPRLTVLTAASASEITSTLPDFSHGMFTHFLLKGLNGAAKDESGHVTTQSLFKYLQPHVEDEARRQNREQTPTSTSGADVVLRAPAAAR